MAKPIVEYPDSRIMTRCYAVVDLQDGLSIIQDLKDSCVQFEGQGLAANQIGIMCRVLVYQGQDGHLHGLINPVVIESIPAMWAEKEGCLSLPGLEVRVNRSLEVTVTAVNEDLQEVTLIFEGHEARIVQHEIDHLDGKLIVDYLGKLDRKMTLEKWAKKLKTYRRRDNARLKAA